MTQKPETSILLEIQTLGPGQVARFTLNLPNGAILKDSGQLPILNLDEAMDIARRWCLREGKTFFELDDRREGREQVAIVVIGPCHQPRQAATRLHLSTAEATA